MRPLRAQGSQQLTRTFRHTAKITLARVGDFNRDLMPFLSRVVRAVAMAAAQDATRPAARARPVLMDSAAFARAQAAFDHVFSLFAGQIEAVQRDRSLTPDQRASAVRALRERQQMEASAARRRIVDDEKARVRALRRKRKGHRAPRLH